MHKQRGFTLLEVVVALAVLAMSLSVVYESVGWALRRSAVAQKKEAAWLTAQSVLSMLRAKHEFRNVSFDHGGVTIESQSSARVEVRELNAEVNELSAFVPVEVIVTVSWGAKPHENVELKSIELARRQK